MSESLEDVEKIVETDNGSSSEVQTNSRSSGYCNGCKIDHTYLRSIEGILRVLTMVSVKNKREDVITFPLLSSLLLIFSLCWILVITEVLENGLIYL